MTILGLDWFKYLALPLAMPKIVEDTYNINLLKQNSEYQLIEKKNSYMSFRKFAKGFTHNGKYDIDGGQQMEEDGRTSLHIACNNNDQAMVSNLLKDGANPNLMDNYQLTPLALSLALDHNEVSKLILKFF